jgi:hypothetical protein
MAANLFARWIKRLLVGLLMILPAACNLQTLGGGQEAEAISGPPVVRLVAPLPNATYLEGVSVNIQAAISNAGADIDRVEVLVDNAIFIALPQPNSAGAALFSISQSWPAAGVGAHTIDVIAFRADGSSSAPGPVTINVIGQLPQQPAQPSATFPPPIDTGSGSATTSAPTAAPDSNAQAAPTTAPPTDVPAPEPTSNRPTATLNQGLNVRRGPSTLFNPPIGSLAAGETVDVLARSTGGDWLKIRYYNGDGWIASGFVTLAGDQAGVTVEAGPAIPTLTPVPPTPVPATPVPATNINLVLGNVGGIPNPPQCGQTMNITVDVANFGSTASPGGSIAIEAFRIEGNIPNGSTRGSFGALNPGQTLNSGNIPLTISTYKNEAQRIVVRVDPDGAIAETNEGDNSREITFTLGGGSCP